MAWRLPAPAWSSPSFAKVGRKACIVLLSGLLVACGEEPMPPATGQPAPAFVAHTLTGAAVKVPADYAGRVVALRFWADWCPYCREEMAALAPVQARLRDRGLTLLAINVAQDADTVARFARGLGIDYPILLDTDGAIARAYGVRALPVTYLLDRDGRVRGKIVGEATAAVFEARVRELLHAP
ncbi:MAG: Thiol-disulfide isomerase and thioredoxin [bacterium]|nr:MAG: Thiol-disulfide isomerase and thioredoxin [bacterium]KAF0148340.1 MAG: Thiol-disulfide isomerase and thioredoxin [bacterium]KAF0167801.1 MAG: Thiol-disulfide isomerase and thioredoxin [bacterium]TXT18947.1 MAG: Thiol-disulfide isomerase and thioredoxin [bacterium]